MGRALGALSNLVDEGMGAHDDADGLARQARRLLSLLEDMAGDLAQNHNVRGPKTTRALNSLMETVQQLIRTAAQTADDALTAAEAAEAEEVLMARHYRPVQTATTDAGLLTPSARIHNS
ncbi:hypothetical protein [Streptomyces sp. Isolate_45]|uniref:hypothetical protein n=1 Tax=Streptomyces sp. Isolate_45 TaxID=2950111 RepID=UPI002481BC47|nr:hypothetical protein [Streptomyces sp. Isolate_45]MDA5284631.1 hypothetical protein [Streptomyces sp. Isolate_45]